MTRSPTTTPAKDGDNAGGGGPVERIIDVNFDEDRFLTPEQVTFAANTGAGTGGTLAASANNALASVLALAGGTGVVAAQFTFAGRTYLAIDEQGTSGTAGTFDDGTDLLLDITGATGTIGAGDFGVSPFIV